MESLEQPKSLVDRAYEAIRDAVCDGTLKPGERITQDEIALRLDVSRQPVTHALTMLKAQGFLIETGRRGLAVAPVRPELFEAIYQLRSAVEPLAVRLATSRLDENAVGRLRGLVAHGRSMVGTDDRKAVLQADMDFHSFVYELSGNPMICEAMSLNWQHLRRGMGEVLRSPGLSIAVWEEHRLIVELMIRGEADEAAALMHRHIVGAYDRVANGQTLAA